MLPPAVALERGRLGTLLPMRCGLCDRPMGGAASSATLPAGNVEQHGSVTVCLPCAGLTPAERKPLRDQAMIRMLRGNRG